MSMLKLDQFFQLVFIPHLIRFSLSRIWDITKFDRMNLVLILLQSGPNYPLSAYPDLFKQPILTKRRPGC